MYFHTSFHAIPESDFDPMIELLGTRKCKTTAPQDSDFEVHTRITRI